MKLSERIKEFRADRPNEWTMDDFYIQAAKLESRLQAAESKLEEMANKESLIDIIHDDLEEHIGTELPFSVVESVIFLRDFWLEHKNTVVQSNADKEIEVTDEMALNFHKALTDSSIGEDDLNEIKIGLRAALSHLI